MNKTYFLKIISGLANEISFEEQVNYSSIINTLKYKDRAMNIDEFVILPKSKEEYSFHSLHWRIHVGCVPGSAGGSLQQSPYVATYNLLTTDMSLASLRIGHLFDVHTRRKHTY